MFRQVPGPATAGPRGGAGRGCGHQHQDPAQHGGDHDQGGVCLCHYTATPYTGLAHNNQLHPRPQRQLLLRALLHHARLGHRACHQRSEPGGGWSGAIRFQVTRPVTAQIIDNASKYLYFSESYFESEETLKYKLG